MEVVIITDEAMSKLGTDLEEFSERGEENRS